MGKSILFIASHFLIYIIRFYQIYLSPILGEHCRFNITCSEYAIRSIKKNGILISFYFIFKRLLKCHPYDLKTVFLKPIIILKNKINR